MPDQVPLRMIDILVYPFYAGGIGYNTEHNKQKLANWMKEIEHITADPSRALIVIHYNTQPRQSLDASVRPLYDAFAKQLAPLLKQQRAYETVSGSNLRTAHDAFLVFKKHGFDTHINFRYYGQHAQACVRVIGAGTAHLFARELIERKIIPNPNQFHFREVGRLCVKFKETYAAHLSANKNHRNPITHEQLTSQEAHEFISRIEHLPIPLGRKMLFMIRKPKKVQAALRKVR